MLSPEQIIESRKALGISTTGGIAASSAFSGNNLLERLQNPEEPRQNFMQRVFGDVKDRISNIGEISKDTSTNPVTGGLQIAKQVTGIASDVVGEGVRSIIGKKGEEAIGKVVAPVVEKVQNSDVAKQYNEWKVQNPQSAKTLEATLGLVGDVATIVPVVKAGQAVVKGAKAGVTATKSALGSAKTNLSSYPSKIADSISEKITKLDPQVKNVLETANIEKFNNYVKVGEEAVKNPRALTPLQVAGDNIKTRVLPAMKEDLGRIGSQKAKTLSSIGKTQIKDATKEATDFIENSFKTAKLTKEETKLVKGILNELKIGKSPTISTVDKTVDLLQNTLYEKAKGLAVPVTSRVQGVVNQAIGKLNKSLKDAASKALGSNEYGVLNDAYATKINLFNKVNKLLGEEGIKGGSVVKRFFSPSDAGTKKLFAEIQSLYGIDLAEDATLAKFVMESLGDTRAASLLEQVPLSKGGVASRILKSVEGKLTKPIQKARKVIESRAQ